MNLAETARIRARLKYEYAPHADVTEIANASRDILALLEAVEKLTVASDDAFRRGTEAMRTAILHRVSWGSDLADVIRNEPTPEYEP